MGGELHLTGDPATDAALFQRERVEEELGRTRKELHEAECHSNAWEIGDDYLESLRVRVNNLTMEYNVFNELFKKKVMQLNF